MKLNVEDMLKEMGKSKYWLSKQVDMAYVNYNKMINNKTSSIRYDILEQICTALDCTPNDILEYTNE